MRYQNANDFKGACGYEISGAWYPRVTKILEIKSKPGLDLFFKEVGNYASAEDIKNRSAEEGSLVHKAIEASIQGTGEAVLPAVKPALDAFHAFQEKRRMLFYPEFIERQIWSPKYRYAGTVDALVSVDGKFGVLDIKTSSGFYPEYQLQTAAYVAALKEYDIRKNLSLPAEVETRWILRIDQKRHCARCGATMREKGGRSRIKQHGTGMCEDAAHEWGEVQGEAELRELPPTIYQDTRAFIAAKILWEWEHNYWLRHIGYI